MCSIGGDGRMSWKQAKMKEIKKKVKSRSFEKYGAIYNAFEYLLSELDQSQKELNTAITASGDLGGQILKLQVELQQAQEKKDAYYENAKYTESAFHEVESLRDKLQSAQQEIDRLQSILQKPAITEDDFDLWQRREQKLVEGLQHYANDGHIDDGLNRTYSLTESTSGDVARDILKELGVMDE